HDWPYDATVWYRWSAPATGTWHFATTTGAVGVYTGTMLRDLVENAETPWSGRSLDVAVVAGGTCWIAVDAETSYGYDLPFTLSWRQSLASANDLFGSALPLSGSAGTVTQSNDEASVELGEPLHAGAPGGVSLWYTFTAPSDGTLALDTLGSSFDTVLGVYTGSSPGGLHEVASSDDYAGSTGSGVRVAATAGTIYRIAVDDALLYNGDIPANTVV